MSGPEETSEPWWLAEDADLDWLEAQQQALQAEEDEDDCDPQEFK